VASMAVQLADDKGRAMEREQLACVPTNAQIDELCGRLEAVVQERLAAFACRIEGFVKRQAPRDSSEARRRLSASSQTSWSAKSNRSSTRRASLFSSAHGSAFAGHSTPGTSSDISEPPSGMRLASRRISSVLSHGFSLQPALDTSTPHGYHDKELPSFEGELSQSKVDGSTRSYVFAPGGGLSSMPLDAAPTSPQSDREACPARPAELERGRDDRPAALLSSAPAPAVPCTPEPTSPLASEVCVSMVGPMSSEEPAESRGNSVRGNVSTRRSTRYTACTYNIEQEEEEKRNRAREGTAHQPRSSEDLVSVSSQSFVRRLVYATPFEIFWASMIITNAVLVGVQVHLRALGEEAAYSDTLLFVSWAYAIAFTIELALRVAADGMAFFSLAGCGWAMLDCIIVICSLVEMGFDIAVRVDSQPTLVDDNTDEDTSSATGMQVLRVLRIMRLVRIIRIVRIVRFVRALRTLVYSIAGTLRSLVWAVFLLLIVIYIFGITFTQAMLDHVATLDYDPGDMYSRHWGNLARSMLTLFESVIDGLSWDNALRSLEDAGLFWVFLFLVYISFTVLAVLNVVTGVFCQSAMEGAQKDADMLIQEHLQNKSRLMERVRKLFDVIDSHGKGHITIKDFERNLDSPSMKAYFESLDLDPEDAWTLFKLLDNQETYAIDCEDFVMGCMRLKGGAKAIDLAKVMYDHKLLRNKLTAFMGRMDAVMGSLEPPEEEEEEEDEDEEEGSTEWHDHIIVHGHAAGIVTAV